MRYLVGWNTLGADPDFTPREAETWAQARNMLRCDLYWMSNDIGELKDEVMAALELLKQAELNLSWSQRVGDFVFWLQALPISLDFGDEQARPFHSEDGSTSSAQ